MKQFLLVLFLLLTILGNASYTYGADGLVAAYSFNEGGGSSFGDQSGNNNNGTLSGGASFSSNGKYAGAVSYDGMNDMATVPDASSLDFTSGMTLEAWVNPSELSGWRSVILKETSGSLVYGLYGNTDTDRPSGEIYTTSTHADTRGTSKLPLNTWTYIATTYDGSVLKFYANGSVVSQKNVSGPLKTSGNSLRIGGNTVWGEYFKGKIDEVRIYNRALSGDEIQSDMNTAIDSEGPSPIPPTPTAVQGPSPTPDPKSQTGVWGNVMNWPIVAVHMSLMPNGKVLAWDGWEIPSTPRLWDPQTNAFTQYTNEDGLFCSAHSHLANGKLLVVGGYQQNGDGIVDTNLFDHTNNTWTALPDMEYQRWYPTTMTLSDGKVLALSGMISTDSWADRPEIYNPQTNSWQTLNAINTSNMHDTVYPYIFPKSDGTFYVVSPDTATLHSLNLSASSWTPKGTSPIRYGSLVAYGQGKLLMTGGGDSEGGSTKNSAAVIDLNQSSPSWRTVSSMQYGRYMHNLIVLPDSSVLVVGGSKTVSRNATEGVLSAELWNPQTETWKTVASMKDPRMYHSTAMLMPDGRVLVGGGGRYGSTTNYFTAEYYSPPYLFKGSRPVISDAPSSMSFNSSISIGSPDTSSINKVVLISISSVTHTVDMDQRFSELSFSKNGSNLVVSTPTNKYYTPPGYYMLFILNSQGVPSVARIIQLVSSSSSPSPSPSSSEPVVEYNFDEGSGTVINDKSGNNHPGTVSGPVSFTSSGKYGGALSFNGSSNYVSVDDASDLDFSGAMTLEAWVYPTTNSGWRSILLKEKSGGLVYGLYSNTDSSRPSVELATSSVHTDTRGTSALQASTWTFVTGTYDGSTLKFYVNGNLVSQKAVSGGIQTSAGKLRIGGNTVWGEYFNGRIDNVRIYNRALSSSEIQSDMNTPVQ